VCLERGPLSLVTTIEELLERKISLSGLENRDYGRRGPPRLPRDTPLSTKVGTNFSDSGCSVGIVLSRTNPVIVGFQLITAVVIMLPSSGI
jgi:hypothetical protein